MMTANLLTLLRLLLAPVLYLLILCGAEWVSLGLYLLCVMTDAVDGRVARATGTVTPFGCSMDSTADKSVVVAALIGLVELTALPTWLVVFFILREFAVFGLRTIRIHDRPGVAAITDVLGRVRFLIIHAGIVLLLLPVSNLLVKESGVLLVSAGTLLAYFSLSFYLIRDRRLVALSMRKHTTSNA